MILRTMANCISVIMVMLGGTGLFLRHSSGPAALAFVTMLVVGVATLYALKSLNLSAIIAVLLNVNACALGAYLIMATHGWGLGGLIGSIWTLACGINAIALLMPTPGARPTVAFSGSSRKSTESSAPSRTLGSWLGHGRRELGMFVALTLICAGLWASNVDFLGVSNVINTTRQIGMLGILAVGISFVIITGGIDLSIGSVVGLTGVLIAKISSSETGGLGHPMWIGIAVAMTVALLIGVIQGLLITRLNLQPFIVTLGFMLLLRGVSQTIVEGGTLSFGDSPFRDLADTGWLMVHGAALLPYPLLIFIWVVIQAVYVLHFTVFGRYVYAIGGNRDAAAYSGIPVRNVETITYVISAGLAGLAGICYAAYIGQMSQQVGIAYELYAIAAAVLGGVSLRGGEGTIVGIIIGTGIMRVIQNGITMFQIGYRDAKHVKRIWRLDTNWEFIIIGAVILIAVILDQVVHVVQAKRRTRKAGGDSDSLKPVLTGVVT